ncbi:MULTISPECIES: hypothetical protein [Alphaproteobacteria]|uniref:Uncharacterized protein n=1 Tax=Thalassospira alkalitolerans TaxID=1293890 RepID=A0A1Y2L7F9_9PROT|nr:hypothetical protein [Thalassospira alkalitolerans]OSQ43821.1 hypothetical protein TALK_19835 [Thalassospira alkalitolerans]|tara:strand:+ start:414760 stop:415035 length:276 start_codon:yes stop_codon:yes gene_type:complete
MMIILTTIVQIVMGIAGGQAVTTALRLSTIAPIINILSGGLGGLALGLLVGGFVGDDNSFFAMLGDAGGGFVGGAVVTVIVVRITRRLSGR